MKKKLKVFIICVLSLFALGIIMVAGINIYIVNFAKPYIITQEEAKNKNYDCVIALGAQVLPDGTPCHQLYDRVLIASEIHLESAGEKLLLSGDSQNKEEYDEIAAMKKLATDLGVNEKNILSDPKGLNTFQSMKRMKDIFGFDNTVIVTQQYHIYRSVYLARKLGIEAYGVCSDPRSYATMPINTAREVLARVKAFFMIELTIKS